MMVDMDYLTTVGPTGKNLPVLLFQITKEINKIAKASLPKYLYHMVTADSRLKESIGGPLRFSLASNYHSSFLKFSIFFVSEIILFPIVRFVNLLVVLNSFLPFFT